MFTIQKSTEGFFQEKRSKFLSFVFEVHEENEAKKFIKAYKSKYHDARHICYAMRYKDKKTIVEKFSDHGEPSGTAGIPILNMLKKHELINTLLIVVRYFGGIKLGTSGLATSYKESALNAIQNAKLLPYQEYTEHKKILSFKEFENFKYTLEKKNGEILRTSFGEKVEITYRLPQNCSKNLLS